LLRASKAAKKTITMKTFPGMAFCGLTAWVGLMLAANGCKGAGSYVWVQDLPSQGISQAGDEGYVVASGDLVNVRVFGQEEMSVKAKVRRDGRLAIPFAGDIQVQGKHPAVIAKELEERLKTYVNAPRITVVVEESQPVTVAVVGEVARAGTVTIDANGGVLQALANAGGLTDFADKDRIFVLRKYPAPHRIRFTYDALARQDSKAMAFTLQGGDVVVVE
jgi:polysaccharide export outer membrane protein